MMNLHFMCVCLSLIFQIIVGLDQWQIKKLLNQSQSGDDVFWESWNKTSITGVNGWDQYVGITFVKTTGKLYTCPGYADNALVIDPKTNASDRTAIAGFSNEAPDKWGSIVFVPSTGKLQNNNNNINNKHTPHLTQAEGRGPLCANAGSSATCCTTLMTDATVAETVGRRTLCLTNHVIVNNNLPGYATCDGLKPTSTTSPALLRLGATSTADSSKQRETLLTPGA